jgi:hypothetical protein
MKFSPGSKLPMCQNELRSPGTVGSLAEVFHSRIPSPFLPVCHESVRRMQVCGQVYFLAVNNSISLAPRSEE